MSEIRQIDGVLNGADRRFGVVAARFNDRLVERLIAGAVDCLVRHGVAAESLTLVRVPGAWELPLALHKLAQSGAVDGLIALGVVIRGETPHFDYVCSSAARGVAAVSQQLEIPIGFGLLTCDSSDQARERAGGKTGNKGWEAALAVLEMVDVLAQLDGEAGAGS